MVSNGDPRKSRHWRKLTAQIVRPGSVCYLCGRPIIFGLRRNHPAGPSLDHVQPYALRPDLVFTLSNLRPCCFGCNSRKGARTDQSPHTTPRRTRADDDW